MRILLLYDNFIRDFRGLLLLKSLLVARGHKIWMWPTWNDPLTFARALEIDILVGGQIAEASTHHTGKFAKDNGIKFVLNSTENVTTPSKFDLFVTYNTSELNDGIIDLQSIAAKDVFSFIQNHKLIKPENKVKYKLLGFPRLDLTLNGQFRNIETRDFRKKYNLPTGGGKVYLFVSSFLLDGAYEGIPQRDLDRWNYTSLKKMTDDLLYVTREILTRLIDEILGEKDVLLIKKHPWDCSGYFNTNFKSRKCIILDNNDYILPCITNADLILHTYTTAAIEAWVLNKRTISILLKEYQDSYQLNHMRNELTVSTFEELRSLINNYPEQNPSVESLDIFSPNLDGRATERLVEEICKLKARPSRGFRPLPIKSRLVTAFWKWHNFFYNPNKSPMRAQIREWLLNMGLFKYNVSNLAKPHTKLWDFYSWENDRARVIKKYRKHLKKYAKEYAVRAGKNGMRKTGFNPQSEIAELNTISAKQ